MRSVPQICIDGTIEAAELYREAFGATFGLTVQHDDGTYAHLSFMDGETELFTLTERGALQEAEHLDGTSLQYSAGKKAGERPAEDALVGIGLYGLTEEAVWRAYNVLKKEAKSCDPGGPKSLPWLALDFHVVDKFGVLWEIGT